MFYNTGVICSVTVPDPNREDGVRLVDVGNYFTDDDGEKYVITSREYAIKYARLIEVPVLITQGA